MGKLVSRFFQIRRVLKLCPFIILTILFSLSVIFLCADRIGYKYYADEDGMIWVILNYVIVILSIISIISMKFRARLRTVPSTVLPLFWILFTIALLKGTNANLTTVFCISTISLVCVVTICIACGRKCFLRRLSILAVTIVVVSIAVIIKTGIDVRLKQMNYQSVYETILSPEGKSYVCIMKDANGEYSVYVNESGRSVGALFGEFRAVKQKLIINAQERIPTVFYIDSETLLIDTNEYTVNFK